MKKAVPFLLGSVAGKLAAIHEEIILMPMQYNTLIGDMGSALSGGQRQRILLARALYKEPKVLFLDEATSALDIKKEKAVNDAVRGLSLTRIIIAHRPETIASAGRVIVLQGGKVVQDLRRAKDASQDIGQENKLTVDALTPAAA